ncbi:MAG: 50S ribosomal protein L21e [Candidatus Nezhaarchaeota archaeon]|nr:50S ribosomal protein L21e [Candidatus Nezhaarchaeota archaeon]
MRRSKGLRTKSRGLLSKNPRERGARGLSYLLIEYKVGDKVSFDVDPSNVETAPHRRYQGLTGIIIGRRGRAYVVETRLGDKRKVILTTPEHIKPLR